VSIFFNVLKCSRFIAQPCTSGSKVASRSLCSQLWICSTIITIVIWCDKVMFFNSAIYFQTKFTMGPKDVIYRLHPTKPVCLASRCIHCTI